MGASALKLTPPAPKRRRGKAPKSRAEKIASFSIPEALARADAIFEGPCQGHIPRVEGKGELVQRFVLPLELCPTTNALISMMQIPARGGRRPVSSKAIARALKEKVFRMMWVQSPTVRAAPLPGRPQLRIVRFSSVEADEAADGTKTARDLLRPPRNPRWDASRGKMVGGQKGFGFIVDDKPKHCDTARWWERAKPGEGFSLIEIWTGEP